MDERKLTELFKEAVPDAPPPSFDYDDVAAESGRQRMRRRNALLGGSALGMALLAGATVLGVALWKGTNTTEDAASTAHGPFVAGSGNGEAAPNEVPSKDASRSDAGSGGSAEDNSSVPEAEPKQGGPPSGNAGPTGTGSTSSGCGQADGELAAALAGELPSAATYGPIPPGFACPSGSRGVTLQSNDGMITIVVIPSQTDLPPPPLPAGAVRFDADAPDGRGVVLISQPWPWTTDPPFGGELPAVLERLKSKV